MLTLILLLVVGAVLAYLSHTNLTPVNVHFGPYVFANIPLFYVIIGSLVVGLVVSYFIYLVHAILNSLTLHGKDHEIKKAKAEVLELTKRVHQLELENEKLKQTRRTEPQDSNAL